MTLRRYVEDYEIETIVDEKGREKKVLKYRGPHYRISILQMEFMTYKKLLILLFTLLVILHVASGFAANPGMYKIYVALPYAAAFLPMTFLSFGLFGLPRNLEKIQRDVMEQSFKRIKISAIAISIILTVEIIGELIFIILNPHLLTLKSEALFFFPELLSTASIITIFLLNRKIKISPYN